MLSTPLRFIPLPLSELCLATVLKSGQSFRWHRFPTVNATRPDNPSVMGDVKVVGNGEMPEKREVEEEIKLVDLEDDEEWGIGWSNRTIVLRQDKNGIHYRSLYSSAPPHTEFLLDLSTNTTLPLLRAYFQLDTLLTPLYTEWSARDPNFKKKIDTAVDGRLDGIRVLKQDPWQTLVSFICSANNNISRIGMMVNKLCSTLGSPLPHPSNFTPSSVIFSPLSFVPPPPTLPLFDLSLYSFPPPSALTPSSTDQLLRSLGFGYRAPFIQATSILILSLSKEAQMSPNEYLESLGQRPTIQGTREGLMQFMGVGRKVADCVALFGLAREELVPVDTHVFQIAIRDYGFSGVSKTTALTPVLHDKVSSFLQARWGPKAGWAQQILFFADLKPPSASPRPKKRVKKEQVVVKAKWELELEELEKSPTKQRQRTKTVMLGKVETKEETVEEEDYPTPSSLTSSLDEGRAVRNFKRKKVSLDDPLPKAGKQQTMSKGTAVKEED